MSQSTVNISACSNTNKGDNDRRLSDDVAAKKLVDSVVAELRTEDHYVLFTSGVLALCLLVSIFSYSPTLCPLMYLGFAAVCLPYRVVSFTARKWTFFLIDFCYFANLACCAFLVLWPLDARLEATVYALCEGPLAAALIAWQCAWLFGSPDHNISVLVHLLPGLALYCHRFLAFSRQPLALATQIGLALIGKADPWVFYPSASASTATGDSGGAGGGGGGGGGRQGSGGLGDSISGGGAAFAAVVGRRLGAALAIARGRVPCPATLPPSSPASVWATPSQPGTPQPPTAWGRPGWPVGPAGRACPLDGPGVEAPAGGCAAAAMGAGHPWAAEATAAVGCYAGPVDPAPPCPAPAWLWLGVAPLAFYLAWQLLYFLVVQVAFRHFILSRGYDTSYRSLARRAQRADNALNRLVRRGSVARRLSMYGLLQLLFTVVTQALAVVTYNSFAAATVWQVIKLVVPLYLGACHQCQRLPAQQLRTAAARLAAGGVLPACGPVSGGGGGGGEKGPAGGRVVQAQAEPARSPVRRAGREAEPADSCKSPSTPPQ